MRFLHTADWQLGMKATHVGAAAQRVRDERLEAVRRVVQAATDQRAEAILVAGDTFEDNGVDRQLVQRVADLLATFDGPVFLLPGNHDPLVPGSVWEHAAWGDRPNLHVLRDAIPVEMPGGLLYPCPCRERHSRKDPTAWIEQTTTTGIRVGLAHGSMEGIAADQIDHPVPRDAAARAGLDYLALGHWHSTAIYPSADGAIRTAYSGTPEPTAFGERDSGNVLLVEIAEPGAPPRIETVHTGGLRWLSWQRELREAGEIARLRAEIEGVEAPGTTLLDLHLDGLLTAADREELVRLREVAEARFLFCRLDDSGLRPIPGDTAWVDALPGGLLRQAAQRLLDLTDPAFAGQRPEGATTEVSSRALLELFALLKEDAR